MGWALASSAVSQEAFSTPTGVVKRRGCPTRREKRFLTAISQSSVGKTSECILKTHPIPKRNSHPIPDRAFSKESGIRPGKLSCGDVLPVSGRIL